MAKMTKCKTCGTEIASSAKSCPTCGAKNNISLGKRILIALAVFFFIILVVGIGNSSDDNPSTNNPPVSDGTPTSTPKNPDFIGECGIEATAEMQSSIIGYPELNVSIRNTTDKDISAIQFYVVPYDVYGEEITNWMSQNKLYTDETISAGKSDTRTFSFIDASVKTVKLYAYSVYFSDGSEWGNKDAAKSVITNNGVEIQVYGES